MQSLCNTRLSIQHFPLREPAEINSSLYNLYEIHTNQLVNLLFKITFSYALNPEYRENYLHFLTLWFLGNSSPTVLAFEDQYSPVPDQVPHNQPVGAVEEYLQRQIFTKFWNSFCSKSTILKLQQKLCLLFAIMHVHVVKLCHNPYDFFVEYVL